MHLSKNYNVFFIKTQLSSKNKALANTKFHNILDTFRP